MMTTLTKLMQTFLDHITAIARCGLLLQMEYRGLSVSLLVTFVSPAKMAEPIEMLLGGLIRVGPRNHVLDGGRDPTGKEQFWGAVQPNEKYCKSLLRCTQQKESISHQ